MSSGKNKHGKEGFNVIKGSPSKLGNQTLPKEPSLKLNKAHSSPDKAKSSPKPRQSRPQYHQPKNHPKTPPSPKNQKNSPKKGNKNTKNQEQCASKTAKPISKMNGVDLKHVHRVKSDAPSALIAPKDCEHTLQGNQSTVNVASAKRLPSDPQTALFELIEKDAKMKNLTGKTMIHHSKMNAVNSKINHNSIVRGKHSKVVGDPNFQGGAVNEVKQQPQPQNQHSHHQNTQQSPSQQHKHNQPKPSRHEQNETKPMAKLKSDGHVHNHFDAANNEVHDPVPNNDKPANDDRGRERPANKDEPSQACCCCCSIL